MYTSAGQRDKFILLTTAFFSLFAQRKSWVGNGLVGYVWLRRWTPALWTSCFNCRPSCCYREPSRDRDGGGSPLLRRGTSVTCGLAAQSCACEVKQGCHVMNTSNEDLIGGSGNRLNGWIANHISNRNSSFAFSVLRWAIGGSLLPV